MLALVCAQQLPGVSGQRHFLVGQSWRLYSAVEWGHWLASPSWQGHRMGLMAGTACLLENPYRAELPTLFPGQQGQPVQHCLLGPPFRHHHQQECDLLDMCTYCCEPHSPFPSLANSPSEICEGIFYMDFLGSILEGWGSWMSTLDVSSPSGEAVGQGHPLVWCCICWGWGPVWSKWNCSSYPSNAFFEVWGFSLTPSLRDLHKDFLSMDSY